MSVRQKIIIYKGTSIRFSADFSTETLKTRREWNDIFTILKDENIQPRILYPAKLSFRYNRETKTFPAIQKLRMFISSRPTLQETVKEALLPETKRQRFTKL